MKQDVVVHVPSKKYAHTVTLTEDFNSFVGQLVEHTTTTAVVSSEVAFDRPETPSERLETFATVLDGAVILPEARCNSPG